MRRLMPANWLLITFLLTSCVTARTPSPSPEFEARIHPDGPLYVSDRVSFEVLTPSGFDSRDKQVQVLLGEDILGSVNFAPFGVGGRMQATLWWIWDTRGLAPDAYTLTFAILPDGSTWQETLTLHEQADIPPLEQGARWDSTESDCCLVYYITATDAERDLAALLALTDEQAADVESRMGVEFTGAITITFLPSVRGHGGFAADGIYVSYLDENYAGSTTAQVLHHELAHMLDAQLGGDMRPTALVEGLAVYLSGGHFKPEPLLPRAAALLELSWYIPLAALLDNFYPQQHEIGYLEAGALVDYLVQRYGWDEFDALYRTIQPHASGKQSLALEAALQARFGISLAGLEENFLDFLGTQAVTGPIRDDLRLTVQFYDTMRRYQQAFDSSAYFMTAWLPDGATMRELGIIADYLRHPYDLRSRVIEYLLLAAHRDLLAGNYAHTERTIRRINLILDMLE